jgi:hypothetical protein
MFDFGCPLARGRARIRSDHARYGKLIKDIGLAVD